MDPVQKQWMYENWLGDHRDRAELAKNHAYLLGSFWNPEAVKQLMNDKVHESSDEELEESMRMVRDPNFSFSSLPIKPIDINVLPSKPIKRKRRVKLNG